MCKREKKQIHTQSTAYKGYWITELYEEKDHKQSTYSITVEDAEHIIKLKATDDENWVVTDTIGKDL